MVLTPNVQFNVFQEREASKEMVVYLVDASPKMFSATALQVGISLYSEISLSPSMFRLYICVSIWRQIYVSAHASGQALELGLSMFVRLQYRGHRRIIVRITHQKWCKENTQPAATSEKQIFTRYSPEKLFGR